VPSRAENKSLIVLSLPPTPEPAGMVDSLILFLTQAVPPAVGYCIYMALAMLACVGLCRLVLDLFGPFWPVLVCSGFWIVCLSSVFWILFFFIYTLVLVLAVVLFVPFCYYYWEYYLLDSSIILCCLLLYAIITSLKRTSMQCDLCTIGLGFQDYDIFFPLNKAFNLGVEHMP
jgi:hypothetical protein